MQKQPKYRFYATLLNAYEWYRESESDTAFQELINKINRVPFVSEAAEKGTAFNALIDGMLKGEISADSATSFGGYEFPEHIVSECLEYVIHGVPQQRMSATIETPLGLIEVYGDVDYVLPMMEQVDLKTTKSYEMPKYIFTWQHIVYPFCFYDVTGLEATFTYLATDFRTVVKEQYIYNHKRDLPRLHSICVELAQFVETHRELITDLKIFNLTPQLKAA